VAIRHINPLPVVLPVTRLDAASRTTARPTINQSRCPSPNGVINGATAGDVVGRLEAGLELKVVK
jgi:hypothetical protein